MRLGSLQRRQGNDQLFSKLRAKADRRRGLYQPSPVSKAISLPRRHSLANATRVTVQFSVGGSLRADLSRNWIYRGNMISPASSCVSV
jgi:hypothetical protein